MKSIFLAIAALIFTVSPSQAQTVSWPSDLKASLDGIWLSERDALTIEIKQGKVYVRQVSQFGNGGIYSDALGKQIAVISEFDHSQDSETYRFFKVTCYDRTSDWKARACQGSINRVPGRKFSILSLAGGLFEPEKSMSAWDKEHRLRKPGS